MLTFLISKRFILIQNTRVVTYFYISYSFLRISSSLLRVFNLFLADLAAYSLPSFSHTFLCFYKNNIGKHCYLPLIRLSSHLMGVLLSMFQDWFCKMKLNRLSS